MTWFQPIVGALVSQKPLVLLAKSIAVLIPDSLLPQDDANNDPQWSEEQLLAAGFELAGISIGQCEVDIMSKSTVAIFEILEKAWATQNCTLVDMKVLQVSSGMDCVQNYLNNTLI